MLSGKYLLCLVLVAAWHEAHTATLPRLPSRVGDANEVAEEVPDMSGRSMVLQPDTPEELTWPKVREGVPPPLCAGRCASPPAGPVCAFDATGTARTFATLCELEAVSCRESTYYAITSLGEC